MNQVKTWRIFCYILAIVLAIIIVKVAFGDETNQKLSRDEQIQVMVESYLDAYNVGNSPGVYCKDLDSTALTLFHYRTKDR